MQAVTTLGLAGLTLFVLAHDDAVQFRIANAYWTPLGPTHVGAGICLFSLIAATFGGLFLIVEKIYQD